MELIVGGKKILRINGMADDSYAQVCLNPNQAVKKSGKDVLKKLIKVFQKLEKFRVFTLGVLNHSKCYFSTPNIKMRPPSNVLFTKILQDFLALAVAPQCSKCYLFFNHISLFSYHFPSIILQISLHMAFYIILMC